MTNIFFVSDTHFGHQNILEYEPVNRPFSSLYEMHEKMIENWNAVVRDEDTVWHLGDVALGRENLEICKRLRGKKKLVMGNHDRYDILEYGNYFEEIYGVASFKMKTILTHVPVTDKQFYRYSANIHGHLHSRTMDDKRYINVSVERWNLTPVSWDVLREKIQPRIG